MFADLARVARPFVRAKVAPVLPFRPAFALLLLSLGSLGSLTACAGPTPPRQNPLTARAAFDMNCPAPNLRYSDLGNHVWGVSGCGARATYIHRCDTRYFNGIPTSDSCAWILNGALLRDAPPAAQ
jgi:hypothetical protein